MKPILPLLAICLMVNHHPAGAEDELLPPPCGGAIPCTVDGGDYMIDLPPSGTAQGIILFFHGYQGSAAAQMKARGMIEAAHAHGLAFAAANGTKGHWSHPGSPSQERDEKAYVGAVLDDLERRFGFGADHVLIGGFSQGASMAYYAICDHGERISGMIAFSGTFWNPLPSPEGCPAIPPPLVHIHGWNDKTFPLAGRAIGPQWHQGDTFDGLALFKDLAQCNPSKRAPISIAGLQCTVSEDCTRGSLYLCLHPGGHEVRGTWFDAALTLLGR